MRFETEQAGHVPTVRDTNNVELFDAGTEAGVSVGLLDRIGHAAAQRRQRGAAGLQIRQR